SLNAPPPARPPPRAAPRATVACATCPRRLPLPHSLQTPLFAAIEKDGAAAAAARYRELRANLALGRYNFGEWEMNELARRLTEAGKIDAAIAMLELNGEFYPKSAEIDVFVGDLQRERGERDKALQRYRAAL